MLHQGEVLAAFMRHAAGSSVSFVSPLDDLGVKVLGPSGSLNDQNAHHICIHYKDAAVSVTPVLAQALPRGLAVPHHPTSVPGRLTHRVCLLHPPPDHQTADAIVSALEVVSF
jgi:hypothetical protein